MDADAADPEPPACEVWEDHAEALHTFLACSTQWQHAGMDGTRTGLLYSSVESVLRLTLPTERHREVFAQMQALEMAALAEFARKAELSRKKR